MNITLPGHAIVYSYEVENIYSEEVKALIYGVVLVEIRVMGTLHKLAHSIIFLVYTKMCQWVEV